MYEGKDIYQGLFTLSINGLPYCSHSHITIQVLSIQAFTLIQVFFGAILKLLLG